MADFHEIKTSLFNLSRSELDQIQKTCQLLLERNTELPAEAVTLYEVITSLLSNYGIDVVNIHLYKKRKADVFKQLCEVALFLDHWMNRIGVIKIVDKRVFLSILAVIVHENIQKTNINVSTSTMVSFFKQAPQYFDNSFPGYNEKTVIQFLLNSRRGHDGRYAQ